MDFSLPGTWKHRGSTFRGLCLPASFRLQGFVTTLLPVCSPRGRVGSVSHRQHLWERPESERSPLERSPASLICRSNPPAVSPATNRMAETMGRCDEPAPGLCPFRESLAVERVFSTSLAGGSSGFSLLGYSGKRLDSDFAESPLIRFLGQDPKNRTTGDPESRSTPAWLFLCRRQADGREKKQPF
jgi:hypothetical protein